MASIYGEYSKQSRLRLDYSYTQSIENNTTTFTLALYAEKPSGMGTHTYGYGDSSYTITGKNGSQLINGNGNWTWGNTTEFKIAESTYTYKHNDDGTGSCTLSASWYTGLSSSSVVGNSMSVSGKVSLPAIPRASTPSVSSNMNMGTEYTINIARASSNFTHTLTYTFGKTSGTIATGAGASAKWTPPLTLANQIPNASSGTGTITCKTYNGSTLIGTKTCSFTAVLPSSYVPSFTSITATRVNNVVPSSWGIYVRTKSKCTLAINGAAGIYGSTIKSYSISGGGYSSTSSSFTTGTLNTAGTNTFTAKITDSRGRTATKTVSITVVDYTAPVINSYSSQRCTSNGTVSDEGTYIKALATRTFASCSSKNTATLTVAYKKASDSSYGTATTLTSGTASVIGAGAIDVNYTYDVKYTLTDAFGSVVKYDQVGPSFSTIDYKAGGKGLAFGKAAETEDLFDCNFQSKFRKAAKFDSTMIIDGEVTGNSSFLWQRKYCNNTDYNTVVKSGTYYMTTGCTNAPEGNAYCTLFVSGSANSGDLAQIAVHVPSGVTWIRGCSNGTWHDWLRLEQIKPRATNADFNTITTPGTYISSATPTGSNYPIAKTGVLEVFVMDSIIVQRYTTYDGRLVFQRGYYSSAWEVWHNIGSTIRMVVRPSDRLTISSDAWANAKINCATISSDISYGFLTQSNGGIKIGKNINYVKVQGSMSYFQYDATGEVDLCIYKNSTKIANIFGSCISNNSSNSITTNSMSINVTEGDVIYLFMVKNSATSLTILPDNGATSLSVEIIR